MKRHRLHGNGAGTMLKTSVTSFIFALLIICCAHAKMETYDQAVGLGFNCQVAHQLEHNKVRFFAYPFDWCQTPFDSLLAFIANEGKDFLEWGNICALKPHHGDPTHLEVVDLVYGITTFHDFLTSPHLGNYAQVKSKYDKRTKRFFDLLKSNQRVLFIRQDLSKEQAEYLDEVLHSTYPNLNYTLLVINATEEYKPSWGLPRIANFYMEPVADWTGNYSRWTEILSQFSVARFNHRPLEEVW